eukprot:scaffold2297_cov102-Isochrysis_galbana.AAC.1
MARVWLRRCVGRRRRAPWRWRLRAPCKACLPGPPSPSAPRARSTSGRLRDRPGLGGECWESFGRALGAVGGPRFRVSCFGALIASNLCYSASLVRVLVCALVLMASPFLTYDSAVCAHAQPFATLPGTVCARAHLWALAEACSPPHTTPHTTPTPPRAYVRCLL